MAEEINATCSICGKGYHLCRSCKDVMSANPWKLHTDTSEHYKIFQIIHGYTTGVYDKKEAKAKFKNVDLSDLDSLRENIRAIINEITGGKKAEPMPLVAEPESEPEVVETVEPDEEEAQPAAEEIVNVADAVEEDAPVTFIRGKRK